MKIDISKNYRVMNVKDAFEVVTSRGLPIETLDDWCEANDVVYPKKELEFLLENEKIISRIHTFMKQGKKQEAIEQRELLDKRIDKHNQLTEDLKDMFNNGKTKEEMLEYSKKFE